MEISIRQIREIIDIARSANAAGAARKQVPLENKILQPTPEKTALIETIDALPKRQQIELQAVMWLGRGDFNDFWNALKQSEGNPEHISTYIADKTSVAEFLSGGLAKLPTNA
jgi:hypothetical protein